MTDTYVLAIDPGLTGGIAKLLIDGRLEWAMHMPTMEVQKGKKSLDLRELARIIDAGSTPNLAGSYIELVGAMPGQGVTSMFRFGYAAGAAAACLYSTFAPVSTIAPAAWKRNVGIKPGAGKDASRAAARNLWPQHMNLFAQVKDDGPADAALIGLAGLRMDFGAMATTLREVV